MNNSSLLKYQLKEKPFLFVSNISDRKYLQKKTKRSERKIYQKNVKNKEVSQAKEYNYSTLDNSKGPHQMVIDQFFENKNMNTISSINELKYLQNINIYKSNKNSKSINKNKKPLINNPFEKFSKMLMEKKEEGKYDVFISNGIFNESEISKALDIRKEFRKEINESSLQETDKLIKITNYFLNKGFNEKIRFIIFKCLINYGIPNIEKFNIFFNDISLEFKKKKITMPEKMCILLYVEYINNIIKNDNYSIALAKNKYICDFFFNGETLTTIRSNLNFINAIKNNSKDIENYLQLYLNINFDNVFKDTNFVLNKDFDKSKNVLYKILFNIISKCEKVGYLSYKKIIADNDVIFNGLKIKGDISQYVNKQQLISKKLFGKELSEAKFRQAIQEYFLLLVSNFQI